MDVWRIEKYILVLLVIIIICKYLEWYIFNMKVFLNVKCKYILLRDFNYDII